MANINYDAKSRYMLDLDYDTIISTCVTDKDYSKICEDTSFWLKKVKQKLNTKQTPQEFLIKALDKNQKYYIQTLLNYYSDEIHVLNTLRHTIKKRQEGYALQIINKFANELNLDDVLTVLNEENQKPIINPNIYWKAVKEIKNYGDSKFIDSFKKLTRIISKLYQTNVSNSYRYEYFDIIIYILDNFFPDKATQTKIATDIYKITEMGLFVEHRIQLLEKYQINPLTKIYPNTIILSKIIGQDTSDLPLEEQQKLYEYIFQYIQSVDPITSSIHSFTIPGTYKQQHIYLKDIAENLTPNPYIAKIFINDLRFTLTDETIKRWIDGFLWYDEDYSRADIIDLFVKSGRITLEHLYELYKDSTIENENKFEMELKKRLEVSDNIEYNLKEACYNNDYRLVQTIIIKHHDKINIRSQRNYCLRTALEHQNEKMISLILKYRK